MKLIAMQWIKFDKIISSMLSCLPLITVMNIIYWGVNAKFREGP